MGDPINPLDNPPEEGGGLPAAEPMEAPIAPAETSQNGAAAQEASKPLPSQAEVQAAMQALGLGGAAREPQRPQSSGPVIGDIRQLAVIQQDAEQTLAEAKATRRAVQLLAISLGAIAVLAILYTARAARAGQVTS